MKMLDERQLIEIGANVRCRNSRCSCVADAVADGEGANLELRASTEEIGFFGYDFLIEFDEPLRKMQRFSVSNAVSSAKKLEHSPANLSGQKVLRFG